MKIIPRDNKLLVKPAQMEEQTSSGLYIPKSEEIDEKAYGEVLDSKVKDIKKGQVVIYYKFNGERIKLSELNDSEEYIILDNDDVIAFLVD
jgi:co-chaperonin GroES (HSP10)